MGHEEKFKDLLSSTFQISTERRVLGLESEVNTNWGFICLYIGIIAKSYLDVMLFLFSEHYQTPRV